MDLDNNELIYKVLDNNILISSLAKEELLKRDLSNLLIDDDTINLVINKLSIEELWNLANTDISNHFIDLVTVKLNQILDYYQNKNLKEFLLKKNENKIKLFSLK